MDDDPPELGRAHMPHARHANQGGPPAAAVVAGVPATGEFRGARERDVPELAERRLPVIATLLSDATEMVLLRRLVGSVHHWHPEAQLLVYLLSTDLPPLPTPSLRGIGSPPHSCPLGQSRWR